MACLIDYAQHYRSKHVLITAGANFAYVYADVQYDFLDSVMKLLNNKVFEYKGRSHKFVFKYSTLDEYFTEMKASLPATFKWPIYKGDFLPYNAATL